MSDVATRPNYDLRDEIKAYWSERAATFDLSPGHEIFSEEERAAWHRLILRHLGEGAGRSALDLASGTGVVSHLLDDLGFRVAGMDWSEPMLERARQKAKSRGRDISFRMGDAENTMEPDDHYDVVVNRHLVWTLVDPAAAFREWLRLLKPGGRVLIVDGDFVNVTRLERFFSSLNALGAACRAPQTRRAVPAPGDAGNASKHSCPRPLLARGARRGLSRAAAGRRVRRYNSRYRSRRDTSDAGEELESVQGPRTKKPAPLCDPRKQTGGLIPAY